MIIKNAVHLFIALSLFSTALLAQTFQGKLKVQILDDFSSDQATMAYFLYQDKIIYELILPQTIIDEQRLKSGSSVIIEGVDTSLPEHPRIKVNTLTINASPLKQVMDANEPRIVALLVNFNDLKATDDITHEEIDKHLYGGETSIRNNYKLSSFGKVKFNRIVSPQSEPPAFTVSLNYNAGDSCDYKAWYADVINAAAQSGLDLSPYQYHMLIFPTNVKCVWLGLGESSCVDTCASWVRVGTPAETKQRMAHELGHNFGMGHAGSDHNNDGKGNVYGDYSCVMGWGYSQINAPHRDQMEWLTTPSRIMTVTASGQYTLKSLDVTEKGLQVLKIKRNKGRHYYVSFRTGSSPFGMPDTYVNKVSIHAVPANFFLTYFIKALATSEIFIDKKNGITVTVTQINKKTAVVDVKLDKDTV